MSAEKLIEKCQIVIVRDCVALTSDDCYPLAIIMSEGHSAPVDPEPS
jgi:hypothetical protein